MKQDLIENPSFDLCEGTALILEGGGFRGIYTAGILDRFLEEELHFPYIIGVSMGAITGINYVSKQHGRMIDWCSRYIPDRKYMSFYNLIHEGNFFSHDYGFNEAARRYLPYNFKTFYNAPEKFYFTATDVETGGPRYFEKLENDAITLSLATSAVPLMSQMIDVDGRKYLDGGIADSVPVGKAITDGYDKLVIVLTRPPGYRKKGTGLNPVVTYKYKNYPELLDSMRTRNARYNETMEFIEELERHRKAFVFRLEESCDESLIMRDTEILHYNYEMGYKHASERMVQLKEFLADGKTI